MTAVMALAHNFVLFVAPFLFVLTLVVTIHELGHFLVARACGVAVERFSIGFGRAILAWRDRSGVEWRIGWIPLGGYVKFAGDNDASSAAPDDQDLERLRTQVRAREGDAALKRYFHFKPLWQRAAVVAAGPIANFILSIAIFAVLLGAYGKTVLLPRVGAVAAASPAARAGFQPGDLIKAADGRPIGDFRELHEFVALRVGEPVRFTVERAGRVLQLTATPERRALPDPITGGVTRLGVIGVVPSQSRADLVHVAYGPVAAGKGGVESCIDIVQTTVFYLERIVTGRESGDQLGGPLRIAATTRAVTHMGAEGAADLGGKVGGALVAVMSLAAVLSVGIGFMNLLPVPVLDGGHLVFYAYEAVARRPVGAKVQAAGYRIGLALLLGLMVFATWNDLQQLRVFQFLGGLFS